MSDSKDPRELFAEQMLAGEVPTPSEDSLARVRALARDRGQEMARRGRVNAVRWRVAGAFAAAVAVTAVVTFVLAPRLETAAFARDRAEAALLSPDGVFHVRSEFVEEGGNERFGRTAIRRQVWESWIDSKRKRSRSEVVENGQRIEVLVRNGDRSMLWAEAYGYDEETKRFFPVGREDLIETPETGPMPGPAGGLIDELKRGLADGSAKVVDRVSEDGRDYWVVEKRGRDEMGAMILRATFSMDDYRLKRIEIDNEGKNGDGNWWGKIQVSVLVWEVLERYEADVSFDIEDVIKLAKPGTKIEKRPPDPPIN